MAAKTNQLKVTLPTDTTILLEREFDAPRHLVWDAMTKPEYVKQWWGPRGYTLPSCEIDLRVGGEWRYVSRAQDGSEYLFRGMYREITPVERLSYTWIFDVAPFNENVAIETVARPAAKPFVGVKLDGGSGARLARPESRERPG